MTKRWIFHPFMLAIFPIVTLYSTNVYEARLRDLIGPILLVVAGSALVWGLLYIPLRDLKKSALIASIAITVFFGVNRAVDGSNELLRYLSLYWVPNHGPVVSAAQVFSVMAAISLALCVYVIWGLKNPGPLTAALNIFSTMLVLVPLANIVAARSPLSSERPQKWNPVAFAPLDTPPSYPDIYYIILDSYARHDVMEALFCFDNGPFLERLESRGFYVAKHSIANYGQTRLCLSCSLNGNYIDGWVKGMGNDQTGLAELIGRNNVMETLRPLGYQFVTFSTGFEETNHPEADVHFSPDELPFSGFQRLLVTTTPFGTLLPVPMSLNRDDEIRLKVLYTLDHLPLVAENSASTFTFAHLMCPHPPFLFGQDGEDVRGRDLASYANNGDQFIGVSEDKRAYYRGFRDQAIFITKRIEEAIDQILKKSKTPPIIILQSDHGSGMNLDMDSAEKTDMPERMTILNAYYFPDRKYEGLYDTISPVNSFRVMFNTFFGSKLELLPDKSYFSTWDDPYRFYDVTQQVAGKDYPRVARSSGSMPKLLVTPAPSSKN